MRRSLPWLLPVVILSVAIGTMMTAGAVFGDLEKHGLIGALGSVQFVLNTNAAALTSAMSVLIALVLLTVQLTAQRYSFSVIGIFVQNRVNIALVGLFLITITYNLWLGLVLTEEFIPTLSVLLAMVLMTVCFGLLPPYIRYLFDTIRPDNILDGIKNTFVAAVFAARDPKRVAQKRAIAGRQLSQIGDIAITAVSLSDGAVARHSVWVLYWSVAAYLEERDRLAPAWFDITEDQFRGRHEQIVQEIADTRTWVERCMLDELREVFFATLNSLHDVNNTVALVLRLLGERAIERGDDGLASAVLKYFNTFLRASINQGDVRAGYHVLYQYRLLADVALERRPDLALAIVHRVTYYGDAASGGPLLWMAAAAAYDLRMLAESAHARGAGDDVIASIVGDLLETVRRSEARSSPALDQTYKMAAALAAYFVDRGVTTHTEAICRQLASAPPGVVERACADLQATDDPVFWELTDRVTNFDYVEPEVRARLPEVVAACRADLLPTVAVRPTASPRPLAP